MKRRKRNRPILRFLRGDNLLKESVFTDAGSTEDNRFEKQSIDCRVMESEFRGEVISSYGRILEGCSTAVEKESELPFPKDLIRRAIYQELRENPDNDVRSHLEVAYAQLESFVPPEEFQVIQDFKRAGSLAQEMAKSGDPGDIIASARILKGAKGERAVKIEEKISEKMRRRLDQIRSIGMPVMRMGTCACSLKF